MSGGVQATLRNRVLVIGLSLPVGAILVAGFVVLTGQHRRAPRSLRTAGAPAPSVSASTSVEATGAVTPTPSPHASVPTRSAAPTHAATVGHSSAASPIPNRIVPTTPTPAPAPTPIPTVTPPSGRASFSDEFNGS